MQIARNVQVGLVLVFSSLLLGVVQNFPAEFGLAPLCDAVTQPECLYESFTLAAGETVPLYNFTKSGIPVVNITIGSVHEQQLLRATDFCSARVVLRIYRRRQYLIPEHTVISADVDLVEPQTVTIKNKFVLAGTVASMTYHVQCGTPGHSMAPPVCAGLCNYPDTISFTVDLNVAF